MAHGSSKIPTIEEQKGIILSLPQEHKAPKYLVSKQWYDTWESYVGIKDPLTRTNVVHPGPITSGDRPVHEDTYRYLVMWYGISCAKLNFVSRIFGTVTRVIEPQIIRLTHYGLRTCVAPCVRFNLPENIGYIEGELRRIFEVPSGKKSRLWIRLQQFAGKANMFHLMLSHDGFIWQHFTQTQGSSGVVGATVQSPLSASDREILRSMYQTNISIIKQTDFTNAIFALEITDERGNWPSGIPGKPDIMSSMTLVNFDKNRLEVFESTGQLPQVAIKGLFVELQGHLAEAPTAVENMYVELEKDIKTIRETQAKMDEVEKHLADKAKQILQLEENLSVERDAIRRERDDVQTARNSLYSVIKDMEETNKIQEDIVTLNVGGKKYVTSVATLTKNEKNTFSVMFSGRYPLNQSQDGSYFLDRDGTHFEYVLNYLRDGATNLKLPGDPMIRAELKKEAEYYRLNGLVQILIEAS